MDSPQKALALKLCPTILAVLSLSDMVAGPAIGAGPVAELPVETLGDFRRNNSGWHRDNTVADDHHHCGQGLAETGLWRNITIAHRGHGNDGPVNGAGNAGKPVFLTFEEIDKRAEDDRQDKDSEQKYHDFTAAPLERLDEKICLPDIRHQFENPENPQYSDDADDQQKLGAGKQHTQVGRENSEQVNHAEKAGCIADGASNAKEAQEVFNGKKNGEKPFQAVKKITVFCGNRLNAVKHHHHYADNDAGNEKNVKCFSGRGFSAKDNDTQPLSPAPRYLILICIMHWLCSAQGDNFH